MLQENLKSKILDSAPGKYFYGQVIKNKTKVDLQILGTNYEEELWKNKLLTEIDFFRGMNKDWSKCLQHVLQEGEYSDTKLSIKKLSEDEVVIWMCDLGNKVLLETQGALETQKSLLELFIDSIPDIIFYKDVNKTYVTCNNALAKLVNRDKAEIIGKKDCEVDILLLQAHKCDAFDQKVIESKVGITVEEQVFLPSGEIRIMESLKVPFWGPHETLLGIIGICRDITEKRKAEEMIINSEMRFKRVFDNISDAIIIIENGHITEVNGAYEQIYGESPTKLDKENGLKDLFNKVYKQDLKDALPIDEHKSFQLKGRILRGDSEERWIQMKYKTIRTNMWILVVSDITSQVQKNIELEHLRDEFFANLSHEFKTPINLIHSALQLLKINLKRLSIDESHYNKCFNICNQNISRLLKLISNLIDSTKIDSGYFKYHPQNYDIVNVVESITLSVVSYCKQNEIDIIFDTEIEEKILYFDLEMMERIILNLLSNAIKYSKGTSLLVMVKECDEHLQIIVEDNGIGIPKNRLEDIFERFSQVNNRFTKVGEGSGLGLYLVKSFVDMHDGEVSVHSELGKGACFMINLPNIQGPDVPIHPMSYDKMEYVERTKFEFSDF